MRAARMSDLGARLVASFFLLLFVGGTLGGVVKASRDRYQPKFVVGMAWLIAAAVGYVGLVLTKMVWGF